MDKTNIKESQIEETYNGCVFCMKPLPEPWMGCCGEAGRAHGTIMQVDGELMTREEFADRFEIETE